MIGETIAHYRVQEFLGVGGMGIVYRAEDLRLNRAVAVKLLPADLVGNPAALELFQREARLASSLNHPRVCTIHDVGEHEGRPFIVMELLEGQALRDLLRGAPLALPRLLDLALDVAEALVAAHAHGVVHRDLKPANVFVVNEGRHAKVLDFGLADLIPEQPLAPPASPPSAGGGAPSGPTLTQVGAGTPAYVSPEQARGEPLDPRTDLFSFGAVLYEMATGARSFPGTTVASVYDGILNRSPTPPGVLNPELPAELEAVIMKALEKDREARYQTSAEIVADLRRLRRRLDASSPSIHFGAMASRSGVFAAVWRRARSRTTVAGFVLLAVATLAAVLWRVRTPRPEPLTERDSILLAGFLNTTGDPVFDDTLREALAAQLSQSPFLAIMPDDRVRETLRMMSRPPDERLTHSLAREVCERQGAKAMLEGRVAALGRSYVLTLDATDCRAGTSIALEQVQADSKERVLGALGRIASSMRTRLGESLATVQKFDVPIEQATTRSLEALKAYALGVALRGRGDEIGAIPFLKRAVELDPSFASAHSALSAIYGSLGETDERARYARLAYDNRDHVTERERLFIEYQHEDAAGDELRAIEILEMWKQLYPRDYRPPNALAVSLMRLGQYPRAIEEAREAERRNPVHPFPRSNLAHAYRGAGRFEEARRTAEQAVAEKLETLPMRRLLFQLALLDHDATAAGRQLEWGKGRAREFDLTGALAQAVAFEGQMARARSLYAQTAETARRQGLAQVALGYAAQAAWTEALYGNEREALRQARGILSARPEAAPWLRAAATLALAGAPAEAERAIAVRKPAATPDTFVKMVYVPVAEAALRLAMRQPAAAIDALQPAQPYELGGVAVLAPAFLRGRARLQQGDAAAAASEFKVVLDHRGVDPFSPLCALAQLELARALAQAGDGAGSRAAYDAFLGAWVNADPELPVLRAARAERSRLREEPGR
jgi:Flp pilus assembly protein TadD/predicted Ser/Thr protein kinase